MASLVGCPAPGGPKSGGPAVRPTPKAPGAATASPKPGVAAAGATRVAEGRAVEVRGTLRVFLGQDQPAVVSNAGGNFISDQGAGLIQRARFISDQGGGLIQRARFRLAQAPAESALANARVEVLDAAGRVLTDRAGKPLGGLSDGEGRFRFTAPLPERVHVLRVPLRLGERPDQPTGALYALVARSETGPVEHDIGSASSLGARLVLDRYVQGDQAVLDRLPAANIAALEGAVHAARTELPVELVAYADGGLLAGANALEAKNQPVRTEVERIEAILLAGQRNLGSGRQATEVTLARPNAVVRDAAGGLWIAEQSAGRLRHVDARGVVTARVPAGGRDLLKPEAMVPAPDGGLWVADGMAAVVRRIAPDGTSTVVVGGGSQATADGGAATAASLNYPAALALGPDGSLFIGEAPPPRERAGRLLRLAPDGTLHTVAPPTRRWNRPAIFALAVDADGTLFALDGGDTCIHRRDPAGAWTLLEPRLEPTDLANMAVGRDGALYVALGNTGVIRRYAPGAPAATIAGSGRVGHAPDGTPAAAADLNEPYGLWAEPDGTLLFTERGNGLVRSFDPAAPNAPLRTIAGAFGPRQVGRTRAVSLSSPFGLALGPTGRVVVSEAGAHTVKALDGLALVALVGKVRGPAAEAAPAAEATFNVPTGLAYDGDVLYVADTDNHCLRRVDPDGRVTIVAGGAVPVKGTAPEPVMPARAVPMSRVLAVAVGPDHMPYFADNLAHRIWRVRPDGMAEVVAGLTSPASGGFEGDGGPARDAQLSLPTGLAFGPDGNLYVSETGGAVVRRITGLAGPSPTIERVAGIPALEMIARRVASGGPLPDSERALETPLYGPGPIAFDKQGALYLAELGTKEVLGAFPMLAAESTMIGPRIRKITPDGRITTIAGHGTSVLGDPTADDLLITPMGLVVDAEGGLVLADAGSNMIWRLAPVP